MSNPEPHIDVQFDVDFENEQVIEAIACFLLDITASKDLAND